MVGLSNFHSFKIGVIKFCSSVPILPSSPACGFKADKYNKGFSLKLWQKIDNVSHLDFINYLVKVLLISFRSTCVVSTNVLHLHPFIDVMMVKNVEFLSVVKLPNNSAFSPNVWPA